MGIFSGLNARIVATVDQRSKTARFVRVAVGDGLFVLTQSDGTTRELDRASLRRVVALRRDIYTGDEISLLLEMSDSQVFEAAASCPGWLDLCAAINLLKDARPFGEWHRQAQAARFGEAIDIWPRAR
jgi:hypothetical protein